MTLQGKGFFIWKVKDCEGGNPQTIAAQAKSAGLTHVLVKIADGSVAYNIDSRTRADLLPPLVEALRAQGIQAWGWHYVYGQDPAGEARTAIQRVQQLQLDGYVIDAEIEYKELGRAAAARRFMRDLRQGLPNLPVALSSFRFPRYHPQLPWKEFLEGCDYNMPQVYFEQAHNAGDQLRRCMREFQALQPTRPVIPTGPTYKWNGWRPTDKDIQDFLYTCAELNLPAVNFYSWEACRRDLPNLWDTIRAHRLGSLPPSPQQGLPEQYIQALNTRRAAEVVKLYHPSAVHITSLRTVQGTAALKDWFENFLVDLIPNATFMLTGSSGSGISWRFTWKASAAGGAIYEGSDTFGIINGKIVYNYKTYTRQN